MCCDASFLYKMNTNAVSSNHSSPNIMSQHSNEFSYFLGGLALMTTIVSLVLYTRTYLPSTQLKILDELLQETRQIYEKSDAEDLLPTNLKVDYSVRLTRLVPTPPEIFN